MRLVRVQPRPAFYATCVKCKRRVLTDSGGDYRVKAEPVYADLDGEPFRAYLCQDCIPLGTTFVDPSVNYCSCS